jgi:hypothetical protein
VTQFKDKHQQDLSTKRCAWRTLHQVGQAHFTFSVFKLCRRKVTLLVYGFAS